MKFFLLVQQQKLHQLKIESTELNVERPIMNKLKNKLIEITEGRSRDYDNWVTRISLK